MLPVSNLKNVFPQEVIEKVVKNAKCIERIESDRYSSDHRHYMILTTVAEEKLKKVGINVNQETMSVLPVVIASTLATLSKNDVRKFKEYESSIYSMYNGDKNMIETLKRNLELLASNPSLVETYRNLQSEIAQASGAGPICAGIAVGFALVASASRTTKQNTIKLPVWDSNGTYKNNIDVSSSIFSRLNFLETGILAEYIMSRENLSPEKARENFIKKDQDYKLFEAKRLLASIIGQDYKTTDKGIAIHLMITSPVEMDFETAFQTVDKASSRYRQFIISHLTYNSFLEDKKIEE